MTDDDELQRWLDAEHERYVREEAERKRRERDALRGFNFQHAKDDFKRELYRRAIRG